MVSEWDCDWGLGMVRGDTGNSGDEIMIFWKMMMEFGNLGLGLGIGWLRGGGLL